MQVCCGTILEAVQRGAQSAVLAGIERERAEVLEVLPHLPFPYAGVRWHHAGSCAARRTVNTLHHPAMLPHQGCGIRCVCMQVCCGTILEAAQRGAQSAVLAGIERERAEVLEVLPAIAGESYARSYPDLLKLHMLQELEDACNLMQRVSQLAFDVYEQCVALKPHAVRLACDEVAHAARY
jgi:hypothetical protein